MPPVNEGSPHPQARRESLEELLARYAESGGKDSEIAWSILPVMLGDDITIADAPKAVATTRLLLDFALSVQEHCAKWDFVDAERVAHYDPVFEMIEEALYDAKTFASPEAGRAALDSVKEKTRTLRLDELAEKDVPLLMADAAWSGGCEIYKKAAQDYWKNVQGTAKSIIFGALFMVASLKSTHLAGRVGFIAAGALILLGGLSDLRSLFTCTPHPGDVLHAALDRYLGPPTLETKAEVAAFIEAKKALDTDALLLESAPSRGFAEAFEACAVRPRARGAMPVVAAKNA